MYYLNAYATRNEASINVTISGSLPNSCYEAHVKDKYPGGNIVYFMDPGSAQVFIEETLRPGSGMCLMSLMPWATHVSIPDTSHDKVTIFINGENVLTVDVQENPEEYQVISLIHEKSDEIQGCSVVPSNAVFPMIYKKVFGPATKEECSQWANENCTETSSL